MKTARRSHALALVLATLFLGACDAFQGPATKEFACPVFCGHDDAGADICCSYPMTCSRYPDRPCAAPEFRGSARDAGPG